MRATRPLAVIVSIILTIAFIEVLGGGMINEKMRQRKHRERHRGRADTKAHCGSRTASHSQAYLNKVARQLNERPRETLQFETPAERFDACVASTG